MIKAQVNAVNKSNIMKYKTFLLLAICFYCDNIFSQNIESNQMPNSNIEEKIRDAKNAVFEGKDKYNEWFSIKQNNSIEYKITTTYSPYLDYGKFIEKSLVEVKTESDKINNKTTLEMAQRLKNGYTSNVNLTFNVSKNGDLIIERINQNEWDRNIKINQYFSNTNLITKNTLDKTIAISLPDPSLYAEIPAQFPQLIGSIGSQVSVNKMIPVKDFFRFEFLVKGIPYKYLYKVNSKGQIIYSLAASYQNIKINDSRFEYKDDTLLWPLKITSKNFDANGNITSTEIWELQSVKALTDSFNFSPEITKDYRVIDKTGSNIPQDEISKLL